MKFDKVTAMSLVAPFFGTWCSCMMLGQKHVNVAVNSKKLEHVREFMYIGRWMNIANATQKMKCQIAYYCEIVCVHSACCNYWDGCWHLMHLTGTFSECFHFLSQSFLSVRVSAAYSTVLHPKLVFFLHIMCVYRCTSFRLMYLCVFLLPYGIIKNVCIVVF